MYYPGGNATDPIWRVLASSDRISSWTPLKPQHSKPNPNPLANQLWFSDFLTPPTPLIILTDSLPSLNLLCHSKTDSCKMLQRQSEAFHTFLWHFFTSLKQHFIAYRSSKVSDCIFKIHQLWQSSFSRVYSNCCCSCSFEAEIIKSGQSSHNMYSNNIVNFQELMIILYACTKKVWKLIVCTSYTAVVDNMEICFLWYEKKKSITVCQSYCIEAISPTRRWWWSCFISHSNYSDLLLK